MARSFRMGCAVAVIAVVLLGCKPVQLDIDFTVRRQGTFSVETEPTGQQVTQVTLSGILACSGGTTSNSEPLDLFLSMSRGTVRLDGGEASERCRNQPKVWSVSWEVWLPAGFDLAAAPVSVEVTACTNPAEQIDEDCTTARELVLFSRVR